MALRRSALTFAVLRERLLEDVRRRLNNGEFTERGLARQITVSQPHIHNVLKGIRVLTPEIGDSILAGIGASLIDVVRAEELGEALLDKQVDEVGWRPVPMLAGMLGPDSPFPDWRDVSEWVRLPAADLTGTRHPALVGIGGDPELPPDLAASRFALLDLDDEARAQILEGSWYALRAFGGGLIRQVRVEGSKLILRGQQAFEPLSRGGWVDLGGAAATRVVRARVVWAGRDPRQASVLPYLVPRMASS